MSWKEKHQQTSLEQTDFPIHGLFFLDGDVITRVIHGAGTEGLKYPMICFPSGEEFALWETGSPDQAIIHLFGEMDLPLRVSRDEALLRAQDIANMLGYAVRSRGENQLDVWGQEPDERYILTYDDAEKRLINVEPLTEVVEPPVHPAHVLMNDEIRDKLPPLRSAEALGMNCQAVVKYFTPDAGWTWYASEASAVLKDGTYKSLTEVDPNDPEIEDVIFFGLVDGFELELGYFSLSELESVGGGLQLPIERDRHFTPTTLKELQDKHNNERRGDLD